MAAQEPLVESQKGNSLEWNGVHYATMPCVDSPPLHRLGGMYPSVSDYELSPAEHKQSV